MKHVSASSSLDFPDRVRPLLREVPVDASAKRHLCALVSGADRCYHGIDHLGLLWERHRLYGDREGMHEPSINQLIACAIAYHDAIYDAERQDNEVRSAKLWSEASSNSPMSRTAKDWVTCTILATRDHLSYTPPLAQPYEEQPLMERARLWFLDLDMSPIGECSEEFDANTERLRAEYRFSTASHTEEGRLRFLKRVASYPRIFRTPSLGKVFEAAARSNLARVLS